LAYFLPIISVLSILTVSAAAIGGAVTGTATASVARGALAQKDESAKEDDAKKKKPDKKEPFGIHQLTHNTHLQELGPVSPNRQSILVIARKHDTPPNVYVMELSGFYSMRQITNFRAGAADPQWSPAGDRIAFDGVDQEAAFAQINIVDLATTQTRRLTRNNFTNKDPVFTPDGQRLLFTTDESPLPDAAFGILHVGSIAISGAAKGEYFTEDEASSILPKIAPDGKSVFLVKVEEQSGRHSLWEYGLDGKPRRDLTSDRLARIHSYVINAASGSVVIWGQEQPERQEDIYVLDLKTLSLTPLPDPDLPKRNPALSPDGKLIAFIGPAEQGNFVFLYDSGTGQIQQLSKRGTNSFTPVFISNEAILFGSDRDAEQEGDFNEVFIVDLTSPLNPPKKK
jgi:Tol biopolymer transport system component